MPATLPMIGQLLQSGQVEQALREVEDVLRRTPGDLEAQHLKAMALGRAGHVDESAALFDSIAATHPAAAAVRVNQANMLRRAGRVSEARDCYQAAIDADASRGDAWLGLGSTSDALGDQGRAREAYEALLKRQPRNAGALNGLGLLNRQSGLVDDAEARFSQALAAEPKHHAALVNRGALRVQNGRLEAGVSDLALACRLYPQSADANFEYANAIRAMGDFEAARQSYFNALRAAPGRADIHNAHSSLLWEAGDEAGFMHLLDGVIQRQPSPELMVLRARLTLRAGKLDEALKVANAAASRYERSAEAHAVLGEIHKVRDEQAESLSAYDRAAALAPDNIDIRHGYAEALLGAKEFEAAEKKLRPDVPDNHVQRNAALQSLAWRALGDPRHATLCDYDQFVVKMRLDTPEGYETLDAFNADLAKSLLALHRTQVRPLDQTLFNGTQSFGRLWNETDPVIQLLAKGLLVAGRRYVSHLPKDPAHPFLRRNTGDVTLSGAWSVRLRSGGGHVDHFHPAGWVSASYYVQIPPSIRDSSNDRSGWIRFGGSGVKGVDQPAERWVQPEAGAIVFFPSFVWHGVEAFEDDCDRITAPFDLLPMQSCNPARH